MPLMIFSGAELIFDEHGFGGSLVDGLRQLLNLLLAYQLLLNHAVLTELRHGLVRVAQALELDPVAEHGANDKLLRERLHGGRVFCF